MIYAIIILSLALPLLSILSYRQGIKDGRAIISNAPLQPLIQPPTRSYEDAEVKRLTAILNNIDNYDGSAKGQKVVTK